MMYSNKYRSIVKSSFCSLTAVLFMSSTLLININSVQAQPATSGPTDPGYMSCIVSSVSDINFGDINLVQPAAGTQDVIFKPSCESSYYTPQYNANFMRTDYLPSGSVCLGIESNNSTETSTDRYLYLNGDVNSASKFPFNFYFSTPSTSLPVGDGVTTAGVITRGVGSPVYPEPAAGVKNPVPISATVVARFNFTNTGLPVGEYTNTFNITLWTGAGKGAIPSSICNTVFKEKSNAHQIKVKVNILPSCKFEILEHVNFGTHTQLTSNMTASGKLGVTCNNKASYEIQLNGGRSGDVNNRTMSLMRDGAFDDSQKISYNLFLPNSTAIWGNTKGTNTFTTTAPDTLQHSIEVKASINPAKNPNPKVGLYRDNVTATIIY